ncbi:MAG TPA: hypothetical protein VG324_24430, partial [Blastocatellia bacterium]|nr:hypothetical protein [Blastocatellia bacterium]
KYFLRIAVHARYLRLPEWRKEFPFFPGQFRTFPITRRIWGGAREMRRPPKSTGDVRFRNGLAEVCSLQGDEPGNQHRHRTII